MAEIPTGPQGPIKPRVFNPDSFKRLERPTVERPAGSVKTFSETMGNFVNDVNDLQGQAATSVERFLTGEIKDAHDVMIAVEKASVSFELMMELRNKMVEAYHEVFRMQV